MSRRPAACFRAACCACLCVVLLPAPACLGGPIIVITFDSVPAATTNPMFGNPPDGIPNLVVGVAVSQFTFTVVNPMFPGDHFHVVGNPAALHRVDNGTPYLGSVHTSFHQPHQTTIRMTYLLGEFRLLSLDYAELSDNLSLEDADKIVVTAYYNTSTGVQSDTAILFLDHVNDGAGGQDDFQQATFNSRNYFAVEFTGLPDPSGLNVNNYGFSLDNIEVELLGLPIGLDPGIPEPASIWLFAGVLLLAMGARRFRARPATKTQRRSFSSGVTQR